jgi:hypothetical protein
MASSTAITFVGMLSLFLGAFEGGVAIRDYPQCPGVISCYLQNSVWIFIVCSATINLLSCLLAIVPSNDKDKQLLFLAGSGFSIWGCILTVQLYRIHALWIVQMWGVVLIIEAARICIACFSAAVVICITTTALTHCVGHDDLECETP